MSIWKSVYKKQRRKIKRVTEGIPEVKELNSD